MPHWGNWLTYLPSKQAIAGSNPACGTRQKVALREASSKMACSAGGEHDMVPVTQNGVSGRKCSKCGFFTEN